jgi:hypothetical protein
MARFYGMMRGSGGKVTRVGTKVSGLVGHMAGHQGAVCVTVYDHDGEDWVKVELTMWQDVGAYPAILLYEGPIDGKVCVGR